MSLLKKALLAASLAVSAISVANALTIDIDDRTESITIFIDGAPRFTGLGESFTLSSLGGFQGLFTAANLQFIILNPGTINVSDIVSVLVTPHAATGTTDFIIDVLSDAENPLAHPAPPPFGVTQLTITETGDFQIIYSSPDLSTQGNPDWVFRFASGIDAVPEPATLALLSVGLAGIGFSRRRV